MINRISRILNNKIKTNPLSIDSGIVFILDKKYDIETTTSLDLHNNQLTSIPDLSKLVNLEYLYLYNNQLTSIPDLSKLVNLQRLDLSNNELTSIPDLSKLVNLRELYLNNNKLTELPDLSKLVNLETLLLYNNKLTENEINKIIKMLPNCNVYG